MISLTEQVITQVDYRHTCIAVMPWQHNTEHGTTPPPPTLAHFLSSCPAYPSVAACSDLGTPTPANTVAFLQYGRVACRVIQRHLLLRKKGYATKPLSLSLALHHSFKPCISPTPFPPNDTSIIIHQDSSICASLPREERQPPSIEIEY